MFVSRIIAAALLFLASGVALAAPNGRGPEFLDQVMKVYGAESAKLQESIARNGEDAVKTLIATGKPTEQIEVTLAGLGRAELILLKNEIAIRVVHEASGIVFVVGQKSKIDLKWAETRQYTAEQHMNAGQRETRPVKGRDVVYILLEEENIAELEEQPRNRPLSREWRQDWKLATWRKPTQRDIALGTVCALAYGATFLCANMAHQAPMLTSISWTAAWCLTQGVFVQALNRWTYRGLRGQQILKAGSQSLIFNYVLSIATHDTVRHLTLYDPSGWLTHLQIWTTVAVNASVNLDYRAPIVLRHEAGLNDGKIELTLPNGKSIALDRYDTERNLIGVATFPISILDIIGIGLPIPGTGLKAPAGKLTLLAGVPILRRFNLWFAQHYAPQQAALYKARWEDWLPLRLWNQYRNPWSLNADECGRALLPQKVLEDTPKNP